MRISRNLSRRRRAKEEETAVAASFTGAMVRLLGVSWPADFSGYNNKTHGVPNWIRWLL